LKGKQKQTLFHEAFLKRLWMISKRKKKKEEKQKLMLSEDNMKKIQKKGLN